MPGLVGKYKMDNLERISKNLEGPFYESHYLSESENTGATFKHLRSRMSTLYVKHILVKIKR
jgi:hypothetical protein